MRPWPRTVKRKKKAEKGKKLGKKDTAGQKWSSGLDHPPQTSRSDRKKKRHEERTRSTRRRETITTTEELLEGLQRRKSKKKKWTGKRSERNPQGVLRSATQCDANGKPRQRTEKGADAGGGGREKKREKDEGKGVATNNKGERERERKSKRREGEHFRSRQVRPSQHREKAEVGEDQGEGADRCNHGKFGIKRFRSEGVVGGEGSEIQGRKDQRKEGGRQTLVSRGGGRENLRGRARKKWVGGAEKLSFKIAGPGCGRRGVKGESRRRGNGKQNLLIDGKKKPGDHLPPMAVSGVGGGKGMVGESKPGFVGGKELLGRKKGAHSPLCFSPKKLV